MNQTRVAKAPREERVPTLEQIRHLICMMPANTELERRDRALVAFIILTGARDRATASIKLKHVDLDKRRNIQDARQVNTKFSKTFTTWLTIAVWRTSLDVIGSHARFSTTELLALTYTDPVLD
jgi:integrase